MSDKAEKKEQLLKLDPPNELRFRGPFNKTVVTTLKLKNPTEKVILFKIKTTAPKKYCVRPNFGSVKPDSEAIVEIMLQPCAFDSNEKNRHKFMVQSFVVPDGVMPIEYDNLWSLVKPEQLMDSKLRCIFELPETSAQDSPASLENTVKSTIPLKLLNSNEEKQSGESGDYYNEYHRTTQAVRSLEEEESRLRQENLKLREDLLRLESHLEAYKKGETTSAAPQFLNRYSPPPQITQSQIQVVYIGLAVLLGILGFILGKFI